MMDVATEIAKGNEWYVGDQFDWARRPGIVRIYERRRAFLLRCLEDARAQRSMLRCLDVGCGDGYWLSCFQSVPGTAWTAFDYNPVRIERARRAAPRALIEQADLFGFVPIERFDLVLMNQVIEHVPDDDALLRRVADWLQPGGRLVLGTTNEGNGLQSWRRRRRGSQAVTDHVHFYTEREVRDKLAAAGWRVRAVYREVASLGVDRLDGYLWARRWGFALLSGLVRFWPSACSDFYFACERQEP